MNSLEILKELKKSLCSEIEIFTEGINRIVIVSPFTFDDGDNLNVILKNKNNTWYFTDEGSTLMHLSYQNLDKRLEKGKKNELFENIVYSHRVINVQGELISHVENEDFGTTYFEFTQCIIEVINLATVTQKNHIESMFCEEFKRFLKEELGERCIFNYHNHKEDPQGKYIVDCVIMDRMPLFIFGIRNNDKCRDVTITCHMFLEWGTSYNSIAIFEDQEKINNKVLARFSDVIDKQYSTLPAARGDFHHHLSKMGIEMN